MGHSICTTASQYQQSISSGSLDVLVVLTLTLILACETLSGMRKQPAETNSTVHQSPPCLRTVTSDRKICYGPQLTPMHNDVVVHSGVGIPEGGRLSGGGGAGTFEGGDRDGEREGWCC